MTGWKVLFFYSTVLVLATNAAFGTEKRQEFFAGIHRINAEIADNDRSRELGLSFRLSLKASDGMLFVFPQAERHCMWMHDTTFPLSVAFIDEQSEIVNIEDMEPMSDAFHCADRKVRYVLEMRQGWFTHRNIGPGKKISGIIGK